MSFVLGFVAGLAVMFVAAWAYFVYSFRNFMG